MRAYKPYIREFLVIFFVVATLALFPLFSVEKFIQGHIALQGLSYFILAGVLLLVFYHFRKVVRTGIAAMIDGIFRTKCEASMIFVKCSQLSATTFSDRLIEVGSKTAETETRYTYVFVDSKKEIALFSAEPFDIIPQEAYKVVYGKNSKVILSISED